MDNKEKLFPRPIHVVCGIVGMICALISTVIGVMGFGFTAFGPGLESLVRHCVVIESGLEFPVYIILIFISRKALAYAYGALFAMRYFCVFLLALNDCSRCIGIVSTLKMIFLSIIFPENLLCLAVVLISLFLYKAEAHGSGAPLNRS